MKFYDFYGEHPDQFSEPGTRYREEYELVIKDDGKTELVVSGKTDLFAYIQSFKESVDIDTILMKYQNGDTEILDKVQGFYGDMSNVPVDMSEALRITQRGKNIFDNLLPEYKELYGNSFAEFICDPGRIVDYINNASSVSMDDMEDSVNEEGFKDDNKE